MSLLSKLISFAATPFPMSMLRTGKDIPVLLPFYHLVSDRKHPFHFNYEYPSVKRFKEDLDFLLKNFEPISLEELLKGKDLKNKFHLSFDDGLRECHEVVAPILKEKGVPASFFVNPAFVDNSDIFHRYKAAVLNAVFQQQGVQSELQRTYADLLTLDQMAEDVGLNWDEYLEKESPYMNLEQLKELQEDGFSIGAHSWDHPEFWLLDEERQLDEVRESMEWVVANLNPSVRAFAFPFTDFGVSDEVFYSIEQERLCDITFGTAGVKNEPLANHFQRVPMERGGVKSARQLLKTEYFSYQLKRIMNWHIAKRA